VVPFLVGTYLLYFSHIRGQGLDQMQYLVGYLYGQCCEVFLVHILVFASWKKGPYCWLVIAPHFFMGLAVGTYIMVPAALTFYTHQVWDQIVTDRFFLFIFFSFVIQLFHFLEFYLVIYLTLVPEAKTYLAKRERKRLLDEQLGEARGKHGQRNTSQEGPQYIEMRELTARRLNQTDLSVDNIGTAAMTDYDGFSGLGSFTDYRPLEADPQEDDFVDEANNTVPYTKQKRGYGEGEVRIGTSLLLDENIYTLAYVAELTNQLIDKVTRGDD